jgi:hypothetical protein
MIRTPYDPDFVSKIKEIKGRRWNPDRRVWMIPRASEHRARKIVSEFFPAKDPNAWKETAADAILGLVLFHMPDGSALSSRVIKEKNGSTVLSLSRPDAARLEEVNITLEDERHLRESISDEEAELAAKNLQERKSQWLSLDP